MRMRQGWDSEASNWARFARAPGHDQAHEEINWPAFLELLPAPGRRTLDLGCGEGRIGRILRTLGHRVTGIDASAAMVRLTVNHEGSAPSTVADATALPFADGAFGRVVFGQRTGRSVRDRGFLYGDEARDFRGRAGWRPADIPQ